MRGNALVVTDSDEHGEDGHMIDDAQIRTRMMLKRLKKLEGARKEVPAPRFQQKTGARATLIGWGSACGAIGEAASLLERDNIGVNVLQINGLWPFPARAVASALRKSRKNFVIENNATGQLAHLIRAETGIKVSNRILKFDGRPLSPDYIAEEVKKEVA